MFQIFFVHNLFDPFSLPSLCPLHRKVSVNQHSFIFCYLDASIEIFPITSSKLPGGLAATSPPPINLATKPCLSHKLLANNTENALCANRALIPVYVLPEHVDAVQEFILSLGQTLHKFPAPESAACEPFLQPEELNNPNLSDDDSLDSVELVSIFSQMSTSPSSSREHASACIPQPTPSAVGSSTSPRMSMNKYYCILIGKKTGVFWDQWLMFISVWYTLSNSCSTGRMLSHMSRMSLAQPTSLFELTIWRWTIIWMPRLRVGSVL